MKVINLFGGTQAEKSEVSQYLLDVLTTKYSSVHLRVARAKTLEIDIPLAQGDLMAVLYSYYKDCAKNAEILILETPLLESLVDYYPHIAVQAKSLVIDISTKLFDSYNYFFEYHEEHTDGEYPVPTLLAEDKRLEEKLNEWSVPYTSVDPKFEKELLLEIFLQESNLLEELHQRRFDVTSHFSVPSGWE